MIVRAVVDNVPFDLVKIRKAPTELDMEMVGIPVLWWSTDIEPIAVWPKPRHDVSVEVVFDPT